MMTLYKVKYFAHSYIDTLYNCLLSLLFAVAHSPAFQTRLRPVTVSALRNATR